MCIRDRSSPAGDLRLQRRHHVESSTCNAVRPYWISRSLRPTGSEPSSASLEGPARPVTSSVSAAVRNSCLSPR
eukprot:7113261-Alexandrium_andersonii.AAC.1